MRCKVCGGAAETWGRATIIGKHEIGYFRCSVCGFIETEHPYWLEEAYSDAITRSDIGLVSRNLRLAPQTRTVIRSFFDASGKFVDYGGGYGLFVRVMRDSGFDFRRYDKYCANLFATGLDAFPEAGEQFELLTAFEVFEHLVDPVAEVAAMKKMSTNILFTTTLVPDPAPRPGEWWYYALDSGQHISLYTRESLARLAASAGLRFYTNGTLHLFSEKAISGGWFGFVSRGKVAQLADALLPKRESLLAEDYFRLTGRKSE